MPPDDLPDSSRRPVERVRAEDAEALMRDTNERAAHVVLEWLKRAGEESQAVVLYGTLHVLGPGGLLERFKEADVSCAAVVTGIGEWELALLGRQDPDAPMYVWEVMPSVYYCPRVAELVQGQ